MTPFQSPPAIPTVASRGESRPFWSVMIPAYQPKERYLREALESVLRQDAGVERMQIEVVDDGSPSVDTAALAAKIGGGRVGVHRSPVNQGIAASWNTCIQRSRGKWVHLLHQDDYVLPGFYERLARADGQHPEVSLLATRSFYVDAESVVGVADFSVTKRLPRLENGGRVVDDFFYETPILCPGVVVRRSFYEAHGGFRTDLKFVLDCEMWARAVGLGGGLVTPEVLSCYRMSEGNETGRLARTAEDMKDLERLNQLFLERYPGFDYEKAARRVCNMALNQAEHFSEMGEVEAGQANLKYWRSHAPAALRLRRFAGKIARRYLG